MLFNNCQARPHAQLFGAGAFYDLNSYGAQANMATDLELGQHCCVATRAENDNIEFAWYRFSHEQPMANPTESGKSVRVLFGEWLGSEILPRDNAIATEPYSGFFNIKGHFKQLSAIRPRGNCVTPPHVRNGPAFYPEEVAAGGACREGAVRQVTVNAYERSPEARRRCVAAHGTACCICGFSFGAEYGPEADGYIHVHHLRPLSEVGGEYVVDPVKDLRPVCPNCHAVLHLGGRYQSIEDVRQLRARQRRAEPAAAADRGR